MNFQDRRLAGDTRQALLDAALITFDRVGYEKATIASIRSAAQASNGSFFHFFGSKEAIAASLFLDALGSYHGAMLTAVTPETSARLGVTRLVKSHLRWVIQQRKQAKFLFEQSRSEWLETARDAQQKANASFRLGLSQWIEPRIKDKSLRKLPSAVITSAVIGPAQMFCRAWLSGREQELPDRHAKALISCALLAVVPDENS